MEFTALKNEVKSLKLEELRKESETYFEVVILKATLEAIEKSLLKFLGSPVGQSQNQISAAMRKAVDEFGGVMSEQTLYFAENDCGVVFAMLWPWQDGNHITVKIIAAKNKKEEQGLPPAGRV